MHDLLDDYFNDGSKKFEMAGKGQRFVNYLIDYLVIIIISIIFGVVLFILGVDIEDESEPGNVLFQYFISFLVITFYYTLFEYFLHGQTLGKLVTRTMAVNMDGSPMTLQKTFLRSLVRVIPFEAFSFLGSKDTGWHDDMTETMVIKKARY